MGLHWQIEVVLEVPMSNMQLRLHHYIPMISMKTHITTITNDFGVTILNIGAMLDYFGDRN